jgi:hypothetical protein
MHRDAKSEVLDAWDDEAKDILHQGVEPCSTAALVRIRYSDAS